MSRVFDLNTAVDEYCSNLTQGGRGVVLSDVVDHIAALSGRLEENVRKSLLPIMMERYIRIGEETFVANKTLCFNVPKVDDLIAKKLDKREYLALRAFEPFDCFPVCSNNWSWNIFIFESYCLKCSKQFRLLSLIFNKQCSGVVISRSDSRTFFDVAVDFVARSPLEELFPNDVVVYLKENGLIGKAKYTKCSELIEQALQVRRSLTIENEKVVSPAISKVRVRRSSKRNSSESTTYVLNNGPESNIDAVDSKDKKVQEKASVALDDKRVVKKIVNRGVKKFTEEISLKTPSRLKRRDSSNVKKTKKDGSVEVNASDFE